LTACSRFAEDDSRAYAGADAAEHASAMKRTLLLSTGWLAAVLALYVGLVWLECYWNLYDWLPRLDLQATALVGGVIATLAVIRLLTRATHDRFTRALSLVFCLALLALAVYVSPAEPRTGGVFARESASPVWYRGGRFVALALPGVFWGCAVLRRRLAIGETEVRQW
jgi:hypothetical protein